MFERILERVSVSKYQDNFILKGGLLLSAMFGVDNRTTKDMDTTIVGIDISKNKMIKVLNEILSIDLKDKVKFDVVDITNIREDDEYGGDKITPKELKYKYPLLFENRNILISIYNAETILAEKIETVLKRGKFNSRMKDYYDIYCFLTILKKDINYKIIKQAISNTFQKRNSIDYLDDYEQIIESIVHSDKMESLWMKYSEKNKYAKDIRFLTILSLLKKFIGELKS